MKKIDVTAKVMAKVARFERRRIAVWLARFLLVLLILLVGFAVTGWWVLREVSQRQTLELLMLWQQDSEIIAEYWPQVVSTIWEELPRLSLMLLAVWLGGLLLWLLVTRGSRQVIRRKRRELAKYGREPQN